jgi:hypothetical protein
MPMEGPGLRQQAEDSQGENAFWQEMRGHCRISGFRLLAGL